MKTYEQLMKHYWGKIVPMAESAGINPWECVRYIGVAEYYDHPIFDGMLDHYTFAKKVFMGKPAFVGDKVWLKKTEQWITVINGNPAYLDPELCSWTPPTKKRTFMLELDEEELDYIIETIHIANGRFTTEVVRKLRKVRSNQNAM